MKFYLVATNTDYNIITMAESKADAIQKANLYYLQTYGESREDWEAYALQKFLEEENEFDCFAVQSWDAWESYLNR